METAHSLPLSRVQRWAPAAAVLGSLGLSMAIVAAIVQPLLSARLGGVSGSTIAKILNNLGHLPWWADLLLAAVGGAGVLLTIVRRYGLRYAAAW